MATPATYELLARRNAGDARVSAAAMIESIVGCKWSMSLLGLIARDVVRPSSFLRECPGLSAKVMNERLRKMVRFGLITKTVRGEKPPLEVRYTLTPVGRRFVRVLEDIRSLQAQLDETERPASART
ncbi:MAG TPA: winged helix-turn-helix transcriptional regulator [Gemmatimonadaceae bacterium]|nr:winged helix-turn-helix transcriptional regulator [Gemmatimonadaceae bacterium]